MIDLAIPVVSSWIRLKMMNRHLIRIDESSAFVLLRLEGLSQLKRILEHFNLSTGIGYETSFTIM